MASPNLKRLLRWRLKTLLILIAALAAALATWNQLIVPYNLQLDARQTLDPLITETQSVPAKPEWLTKISPERFSRIVQLRGRWKELDDETIAPIADMPFIRRLYLNRTRIGDPGLIHIGQLKELQRLSLWGSHVSDDGLSSLLRCKKLVALDLHDTCVSDQGLEKLVALPELRELILGEGVNGPGLKFVTRMPQLERLDLSRSGIHFDSLKWLAGSRIRHLQLPHGIPARYCDVLATMPNLRICNVQLVQADDRTAKVISQCQLETVDLVGVGITDAATEMLTKMPNLQSLSLHGDLTDDSLDAVASANQIKVAKLNGRFSLEAMKSLYARRPDLLVFLQTPMADEYKRLDNKFLIGTSMQPDGIGRFSRHRRLSVTWPATAGDLKRLSVKDRSFIQAVRLRNPPTVESGFRSRFQREWTLDGLEDLTFYRELQVPRLARGELAKLAKLHHLTDLLIDDDQLTDVELDTIELPPSCARLVITPSKVSRGGLARLKKRYPDVEMRENGHGSIYDNRRWQFPWVGQGSIDDMLLFPDLEEIQIQGVKSTLDLTPLANLTKLQKISFRGPIRHAPIWELERDLPHIQSLSCTARAFNDAQMNGLDRMPSLKRLLLRETTITDAGWAILRKTPDLEEIDMHANLVTGSGFRHLVHCPKLRSIKIQSDSLQGSHLSHLKMLPRLKQLKLSRSQVGDEGCKHLAEIPSLEWLELERTAITDEGLTSLGQSQSIKSLFIGSNRVTEVGLKGVARCKSLQKIFIGNNPAITDDEKRKIEIAFPHVRIH